MHVLLCLTSNLLERDGLHPFLRLPTNIQRIIVQARLLRRAEDSRA